MADPLDPWSPLPHTPSSADSSPGSWTPVSTVRSDARFAAISQAISTGRTEVSTDRTEVSTVGSEVSRLRTEVQAEVAGLKDRMGIVERQTVELYRTAAIRNRHGKFTPPGCRSGIPTSPTFSRYFQLARRAQRPAYEARLNLKLCYSSGLPAHRPRMPDNSNYDGKSKDGAVVLIQRLEGYAQQVY